MEGGVDRELKVVQFQPNLHVGAGNMGRVFSSDQQSPHLFADTKAKEPCLV